jgi:DNA polymerase bacteriophage-type
MRENGPQNTMPILWFDCETYSEADLKKAGTHAYAEHPSTEITVAQWALDDGEPEVCDCTGRYQPPHLTALLEDPAITVVAHNSAFDRTLLRRVWGVDAPVERWRDTMVQAMAHGLPGSLDKLGAILGVADDEAKDKRGRELIQLFCKPRPKNHKLRRATPATHPDEWAEFLEYSRQDIVAMRAIHRLLPSWNYRPGHPEVALWHLDQRVNDRGFAVDVALANAAVDAVAVEQSRLKAEVVDATGGAVTSASQRDELLSYILLEHGVSLPDMRADTLQRRADDPELPEAVRLLLRLRLEATKTSTAKYKALLNAVSDDGRLRNTMQFCGAQRTGRVAHRLFQPGNMPRPSRGFKGPQQEAAIESLKAGAADLVYDNVMRVTSDCVRGCIVAPPGRKLCVADLSNIEGRVLAFLADERWKLDAFRAFDRGEGADIYKLAYAKSFGTPADQVEDSQRQIGKVQELMLGYEGGVGAYLTGAATYGFEVADLADAVHAATDGTTWQKALDSFEWFKKKGLTYGLPVPHWTACRVLVDSWRDAHPNTRELWAGLKDAYASAVSSPGETFSAGRWLRVRADGAWLRIRLPSGRYLCYLQPQVDDKGQCSYMGVDQYTRQWRRIKTHGGKLAENVTQAAARDVLLYSMPSIEQAGYEVLLSIHDELLTETPDSDEFSAARLAALMSVVPSWAPGLPLAAAGFEAKRYRKG